MARHQQTRQTPTTDSPSVNIDTIPSWDTSPNTLPEYAIDLCEWLPKQDQQYSTLVQYGYVLDRHGHVLCVSDNHIARVRAGLLTMGSFQTPTIVAATD